MNHKLKFNNGRSTTIECDSPTPCQDKINEAELRFGSECIAINDKTIKKHNLGGFIVGATMGAILGNSVPAKTIGTTASGVKKTVKRTAKTVRRKIRSVETDGYMERGGYAHPSTGRNWTNEHRHHNKSEDYEVPLSDRKRQYATGGKIIQQISTHKAVKENGTINIYIKGFDFNNETGKWKFNPLKDELFYRNVDADDVFAILENLKEDNRINLSEANAEFSVGGLAIAGEVAKALPSTTSAIDKRIAERVYSEKPSMWEDRGLQNMENGGVIGQEIVFTRFGEKKQGWISENHLLNGNLTVSSGVGSYVVTPDEVISISPYRSTISAESNIHYDNEFAKGGAVGGEIPKITQKYSAILDDFDNDGIYNIDDMFPLDNKKSIRVNEEISLAKTFTDLINLQLKLEGVEKSVVEEINEIKPSSSKVYSRTKEPFSIVKKLVEKRLVDEKRGLTDLVGTTIAVKSFSDLIKVRNKIRQGILGEVLEEEDFYAKPKDGYMAYHFILRHDGYKVELQLKTLRQKEINQLSHGAYKEGNFNADYLKYLTSIADLADRGNKKAIVKFKILTSDPIEIKQNLNRSTISAESNIHYDNEYAKGGGIRMHNGRAYSTGRNWTNDHRHHNKSENWELPLSSRKRTKNK